MNQNQQYEDFFQESSSYYLEKLNLFEKGKKFTFNYAALIFGIFWFLYRKMYLEAIVIYSLFYIESCFESFFLVKIIGTEQTKLVCYCISIIMLIIIGFCGNLLYFSKAKRTIKKAEEKFLTYEQQKEYLSKKGGTTLLYAILVMLIIIAAIALS
ncbi:DUF2628 domain-containing protein [Chryseobacterium aureum]|uniref:DUF2628 domain-containing protein n=1 Tax=Chryseobacterium aureum TaxID=2497456 RepID=UPI000F883CAC|nr:DUF2628 domain-containing protein [Chryseobacterium aureum]